MRVLSRRFRRRFLDRLGQLHAAGKLAFFNDLAPLCDPAAFKARLAPLRRAEWVVYAKRPFGGPQAVLAYLARYTHRVAISASRLVALDRRGVTFRWKDYRAADPATGAARIKTMTLAPDEFLRRFLLHVLPAGFHRIRHYGLLARGARLAHIRRLIAGAARAAAPQDLDTADETAPPAPATPDKPACPCCGGQMRIIEVFARGQAPRGRIWIDSS